MTPSEKILSNALAGSSLDTEGWSRVQAGLRDRAFFSATGESARVLHAMRGAAARVADEGLSESDARKAIREALAAEGIGSPEGREGGIQDLHSRRRLDLVIRHNVESARCYVQRREGLLPGAFLAFPAQELVRIEDRHDKRDWRARWKAQGGKFYGDYRMAALKTDPVWAAISRFGQPWPPFDFGSGMGLRDIGYEEAVELGIIKEDQKLELPKEEDFNAGLSAKVDFDNKGKEWQFLKDSFGDQIRFDSKTNEVHWRQELFRDAFDGGNFTIRLGKAADPLKTLLGSRSETAGFVGLVDGRALTIDQTWLDNKRPDGGDHRIHFKPMPEFPDSRPLTLGDVEILPSVWRNPDRAFNAGGGSICLELDSIDGDIFRAIVKVDRGVPSLRTFYRTSTPYKEKK